MDLWHVKIQVAEVDPRPFLTQVYAVSRTEAIRVCRAQFQGCIILAGPNQGDSLGADRKSRVTTQGSPVGSSTS